MAAEVTPVSEKTRAPLPLCSAPDCENRATAEFYCKRCNITGYCSKRCRKKYIAYHACITHCYYRDRKVHAQMTEKESDCYSTFNFYVPGLEEILKSDLVAMIDNFSEIGDDVLPILILDERAKVDMYEYHGLRNADDAMEMDYNPSFLDFVKNIVSQVLSGGDRYIVWFIKGVDRVYVRKLDFVNILFDKDVPLAESRILYKLCKAKFISMTDDEKTRVCGKINSRAQLDLNAKLTEFVVAIDEVEIEEFADINRRVSDNEAAGIDFEISKFKNMVAPCCCESGALYTFCPEDLAVMAALIYTIRIDANGAKIMNVKLMKRLDTYFVLLGVETLFMSIKQRALENECIVIITQSTGLEMMYVWHVFGFCLTTRPIITGPDLVHKVCTKIHPETQMKNMISAYRAGKPCADALEKLSKSSLVRYRKKHGFDLYYPIDDPEK